MTDRDTTPAGRVAAYVEARTHGRDASISWDDLRAVLAEHQAMRDTLDGLWTEYGVSWRPRGGNPDRPWIDDDIDGATEADARAHAATRPEGRVVRRLVGDWKPVDDA